VIPCPGGAGRMARSKAQFKMLYTARLLRIEGAASEDKSL
jgi:hypothetical protein